MLTQEKLYSPYSGPCHLSTTLLKHSHLFKIAGSILTQTRYGRWKPLKKKNALNCYHLADLGFEVIHIHGANVQQRLDRDVWLTIYGQV